MKTQREKITRTFLILIALFSALGSFAQAPPPGGGSGCTNCPPLDPIDPPDYGTNLWIRFDGISSGNAVGIVSNSQADIEYEIQSEQTLLDTQWVSQGFLQGDEATNWTTLSLNVSSQTNGTFFFRIRSWIDSQGVGIPDWWQLKYFGYVGIDPYADPDGDGYNNLEEFQNGTDPTVFNSPPKGVSNVQATMNGTTNTVTWNPSSSATSYTVTRTSGTNVTTYTVSGGTSSYTDASSPAGSTYTVTANYPSGSSPQSASADSTYNTLLAVDPQIVRGANPSDSSLTPLQIVLGGIVPTNVTAIRVHKIIAPLVYNYHAGAYYWQLVWYAGDAGWYSDYPGTLDDGYFDAPISSFVNGVYQIPVSQLPEWCAYYLATQPISGDIRGLTNDSVFARNVPFKDGTSVLKNNLSFLLRSAQNSNSGNDISVRDFEADYNYAAVSPMIQHMDISPDLVTEVAPFDDNWFMKNWNYDSTFADYGSGYYFFWLDKNLGPYGGYYQNPTDGWPKYQFDGYTYVNSQDSTLLPNQLTNNFIFLATDTPDEIGYSGDQIPYAGLSWDGSETVMTSGWQNHFGLTYSSVRIVQSQNAPTTQHDITPSGTYSDPSPTDYSEYFQNVTAPSLTTVSYYFAQSADPTSEGAATLTPMPNDGIFAVTNTTPLIISAVGQPTAIYGWAKQQISNGDSTKFGYLGQYFDPASATNGILSEYGDFMALQPGQFTLKTKADSDQGGLQGQCPVYAVSLNVDANHDSVMDLTYQGPDTTSAETPLEFWVNDDNDDTGVGQEIESFQFPDYSFGKIRSQRGLEDFARLWVCGVPALSSDYTVTLSCSGSGAINLYTAESGGIGYLTNSATASGLVGHLKIATVSSSSSPYTFSPGSFDGSNKYFLFEGVSAGEGQYTLTISKGSAVVAQSSIYIDLHNVKDFYEQAHIANVPTTFPAMVTTTNTSTFVSDHKNSQNPNEAKQLIVFVHGWRMGSSDYQSFSDTMFKRLYWAGYQGRFASLRWPTLSADDYFILSDLLSYTTYNRSEHIAFDSGAGTSAYLDWLKGRFPDYSINVAAHSMGNVVMAEALKDQLAEGHHVIDNYVMMQAAVPAQCYQTNFPDYSLFTTAEASSTNSHTPDVYRGYPGNIAAAVNNQIVDFFNTNDFALASGTFLGVAVSWEANEVTFKPDAHWNYSSDGTNCFENYSGFRTVTNPHEEMAFVARPRSKAAGAIGGVGGVVATAGQVDLRANFGFDNKSDQHSAQFNWTFQQLGGKNGFYGTLLQKISP